MKIRMLLWAFVLCAALASEALALPPPPEVPEPLRPWQAWALHDQPDLLCASWGDGRVCDWPGQLQLRVDKAGGSFQLDVWIDAPTVVALPGDSQAFPQRVTVDGAAAVVQFDGGRPGVRLSQGHHQLAGAFAWADVPELIALPPGVGVVRLTLHGVEVEAPRRDDAGRLLLHKDGGGAAADTDSLTVAVARRLRDGVPLRMTTRLTMRVGGKARDAILGPVLPVGWRPVALTSPLPAQIGADSALRAHVRPGQHIVDVEAVLPLSAQSIAVPSLQGEHFERTETWVWVPDEAVRSVEVSGLQMVDPERTQLDADWKKGRTFLGQAGDGLHLHVGRRGEVEPPPNHVEIDRQWWLDLDGEGLTSRDKLSGQIHQGWRLAAGHGWVLGRAEVGGRDQLITLAGDATAVGRAAGVELRQGALRMEADARIDVSSGALAAVGWLSDAQRLKVTLHLPPGWTLLGARGVDSLPTTWADSWDLLDFFFVLMLALGFARLLGKRWGALTAVLLVLCHGQPGAPAGVFLVALAGLGLLAALPPSRFRKLVQVAYGLVLVAVVVEVVPFCAEQIRHGIYPQTAQAGTDDGWMLSRNAPSAPVDTAMREPVPEELSGAAPAAPAAEAPAVQADHQDGAKDHPAAQVQQGVQEGKRGMNLRRGSGPDWTIGSDYGRKVQQLDPKAVVQTGPGVPTWSWSTWPLSWNGPVRADHQLQLYLLTPLHNLLLAIARAVLVILLALKLVDVARLRRLAGALQVGATAVLPLLAAALLVAPPVLAAEPPPQAAVIDQLRERLVAAQRCEGPCVVVSVLAVQISGNQFTCTADVSAQRPAAWTIPGPVDALQVRTVTIDGKATWELRRDDHGLVRVRVPAGAHTVVATGTLARRNVLDVQLGSDALPRLVRFDAPGWTIDGLDSNSVPQQSLQWTRRELPAPSAATATDAPGAATASDAALELPPWYSVERTLRLGLPWMVATAVRRELADRPQLVKVPLLAGEVVLTDGVRVEELAPGKPDGGRVALVNFARGEATAQFESQLPMPDGGAATLTLHAPVGDPWTETWRLDCSPIWRCAWSGLPPTHTREGSDGALRPLWQPWPGETVAVAVTRPAGAPGQSITIDDVRYTAEPGQRLLAATLVFKVRTSQGGIQKLKLPQGAEVQSVQIDGKTKTLRPQGRALAVPLQPGAQTVEIRWQQPWQRATHETLPDVDLGGAAANVHLTLKPGESRWLLFAHGPAWGAAVLFWSRLVLVVLLALALGRIPGPPLQFRHWLLLGLGLAPVPVPVALVVIGWFLAMAWRRRYGIEGRDGTGALYGPVVHNVAQLALVGWGVAALGCLYGAIHSNLLMELDMQVQGAGSSERELHWIIDRTASRLPEAGMWSLPLWVWRGLMLGWALWLVAALLRWLPWAWQALVSGKGWMSWTQDASPQPPAAPPPPPPPPPAGEAPPVA
ncbi:MAG: hypothetical protein FJ100_00695 [Deltaproteobacteria bacterium]|nr:hypothetical protein [Deltaproteobacteria bacterium]